MSQSDDPRFCLAVCHCVDVFIPATGHSPCSQRSSGGFSGSRLLRVSYTPHTYHRHVPCCVNRLILGERTLPSVISTIQLCLASSTTTRCCLCCGGEGSDQEISVVVGRTCSDMFRVSGSPRLSSQCSHQHRRVTVLSVNVSLGILFVRFVYNKFGCLINRYCVLSCMYG